MLTRFSHAVAALPQCCEAAYSGSVHGSSDFAPPGRQRRLWHTCTYSAGVHGQGRGPRRPRRQSMRSRASCSNLGSLAAC